MAKYELRRTWGNGKSERVAESDSAEQLRRKEQELRPRRRQGSSTFYSVKDKI